MFKSKSAKGLRAAGGPAKPKGGGKPSKDGAAALRATVTRTSNVPEFGKPITGAAHVSYR